MARHKPFIIIGASLYVLRLGLLTYLGIRADCFMCFFINRHPGSWLQRSLDATAVISVLLVLIGLYLYLQKRYKGLPLTTAMLTGVTIGLVLAQGAILAPLTGLGTLITGILLLAKKEARGIGITATIIGGLITLTSLLTIITATSA